MLRSASRRELFAIALRSMVNATTAPPVSAVGQSLAAEDEHLLDDLCHRCFRYFLEQSDSNSGIARDRARADGSLHAPEGLYVGSTGATGFALTAFCIGAERHWISRHEARRRVEATLHSYATGPIENIHGWYYHFVDVRSGTRYRDSEVSTSDSTWLVAGALTAREYFKEDQQIARLARAIYERVDYRWMLNQHPSFLAHGWKPETGFLKYRYDRYCQLACMYLLGIGSPTYPLDPAAWYAWG
jgi:hypothetical protein